MLAVAGKNQSAVVLDMVAVRSTNKALQARGMPDVASGISQAVNKAVAAHPEWRQVPPPIGNTGADPRTAPLSLRDLSVHVRFLPPPRRNGNATHVANRFDDTQQEE
eukprot:scaffold63337_cov68-Phaeocystis_antarctica.AAC.1